MKSVHPALALRWSNLADDLVGLGYWFLDVSTNSLRWSSSLHHVFGVDMAATPSVDMALDLVHPEDRSRAREEMRAALAGEDRLLCLRIVRPDGEVRHVEGRVSFDRDQRGGVTGIYGSVLDVTRREEMRRDLVDAKLAAESALAIKSEFLSNISHELRTPLTAIIGFAALLDQDKELPATTRRRVEQIAGAGRTLLAMVNGILDLSRFETGKPQIKARPCRPAEICQEAVDLFAEEAAGKGLALAFLEQDVIATPLLLDSDALRQVLINIIGNAVKFTDSGHVEVGLRYDADAEALSIEVSDTGPGIAEQDQQLLFKRFSRVPSETTRIKPGVGIGLSICRALVEGMGGEIGLDSRLGEGAVFRIRVPATPAFEPDRPMRDPQAGLSVLVVDDNPATREIVETILTAVCIDVHAAQDGEAALKIASSRHFDVILVDLYMPGLDGLSLARALRAQPGFDQATSIVAFTASDLAQPDIHAGPDVFDGVLRKPFSPANLLDTIAQVAGRS